VTLLCPGFAAGLAIATKTIPLSSGAPRPLRRSGSFVGGTCAVPRTFQWLTDPPPGLTRIASYVDDCGTTDESSALIVLNISSIIAEVNALPKRTCRVIRAGAIFTAVAPARTTISLGPGEAANCVGSVQRATNSSWATVPKEDHRSNGFSNATSTPLDPSAPLLPIHLPSRAGEPGIPGSCQISSSGSFSIDLTDAMQRWVDFSATNPNDGIVFLPQDTGTLKGAMAPGATSAGCSWDLRLDAATVTLDVSR
jgi:hypothetical protein